MEKKAAKRQIINLYNNKYKILIFSALYSGCVYILVGKIFFTYYYWNDSMSSFSPKYLLPNIIIAGFCIIFLFKKERFSKIRKNKKLKGFFIFFTVLLALHQIWIGLWTFGIKSSLIEYKFEYLLDVPHLVTIIFMIIFTVWLTNE